MNEQNETQLILNPTNPAERSLLLQQSQFELQQRQAKALASSTIIPKEYRNNIGDCMIAQEMAQRLNTGALEIMQNLYVVHGKPAFSATYLIARINQSSIIRGRLRFAITGEGDARQCIAYGVDAENGTQLESTPITIAMAKKEGWHGKPGSKWQTMPDQMLTYRAATFWARVYAPDATMGMRTVDEVSDTIERDITPVNTVESANNLLAEIPANDSLTDATITEKEVTTLLQEKKETILPAEKSQPKKREKKQKKTDPKDFTQEDVNACIAGSNFFSALVTSIRQADNPERVKELRGHEYINEFSARERDVFLWACDNRVIELTAPAEFPAE
jgi:hypothetical protein